MTFEDKIKYQYMKLLYSYLDLDKIEKKLKINGVISKKIYDPDNIKISNYFFLKNDIVLSRLTSEELILLKKYFSDDIKSINSSDNKMYSEINNFLFKNINRILIPDTNQKYICYDQLSPYNLIPSDCICFDLNFIRYNENFDSTNSLICNEINYIQYSLAREKGIKIAVIPYDEVSHLKINNNLI